MADTVICLRRHHCQRSRDKEARTRELVPPIVVDEGKSCDIVHEKLNVNVCLVFCKASYCKRTCQQFPAVYVGKLLRLTPQESVLNPLQCLRIPLVSLEASLSIIMLGSG